MATQAKIKQEAHSVATATASSPASPPPAPRHKTSGMGPPPSPRDPSEPLVLYDGPAQYRPLVSHFLAITFTFIGIVTGYNIREHAVWPLIPSAGPQELMDWKWRYLLGTAATCAGMMTGALFKWVASKNVTRITLFEGAGGVPHLRMRVASAPLFAREMLTRGNPRVITSGHRTKEFVVPLSEVARRQGSAVAAGWVDERTAGKERRNATLQIGGSPSEIYMLETSGAVEPKNEGNSYAYWFKRFEWSVVRGKPKPPYFWSRQAFDELIPPLGKK
ncbi:unnamed protein product [Parajaminaea phylloscopi]